MSLRRRLIAPIVLAAAALAAPVPRASAAPSEMTIIYVDLDRIIYEVDEGKRASEQLAKEQQKRQSQITALEAKLKALQVKVQALAQKGGKDATLQQVAADYQQTAAEYQQLLQIANKEMLDKERELFDPIERRVKELIRTVATKEGVDVVLSKRAISYARKDFDLTERITQEYNKAHPAPKAAAPAAKPAADKKPEAAPAPKPAPAGSAAPK